MKQIKITLAVIALMSGVTGSVFSSDTVYAYKCMDNGYYSGKSLKYENGNCYVENEYDTSPASTDGSGQVTCQSGHLKKADGKGCYEKKWDRTSITPVNNNGTQAASSAWSCDEDHKYNPDGNRHGCYDPGCGATSSPPFVACGRWYDPKENIADTTERPYSDYTDKASCEAAGGKFAMTQKGSNGSSDTWSCMSPKKYIEDADNKQECESRGGAWGTTTVAQNSASAGSAGCTAPAGTADDPSDDSDGSSTPMSPGETPTTGNGQCGKAKTNIISCKGEGAQAFGDLLKQLLYLMTMGVGILAVGGILFGAIMYASAQDNAGQVQKAISIITNTVIGLLLYIFMFAIANWLVPGGVIQ